MRLTTSQLRKMIVSEVKRKSSSREVDSYAAHAKSPDVNALFRKASDALMEPSEALTDASPATAKKIDALESKLTSMSYRFEDLDGEDLY